MAKKPALTVNRLIGARLRHLREKNGLSAAAFGAVVAPWLGEPWKNRQTVYEAEAGKREFRVSELIALARAADVQVFDLVDAAAAGAKTVEIANDKAISAEGLLDLFKEPGAAKGPAFRAMVELNEALGDLESLAPSIERAYKELRRMHPNYKAWEGSDK